jgi:hypothetical protein
VGVWGTPDYEKYFVGISGNLAFVIIDKRNEEKMYKM